MSVQRYTPSYEPRASMHLSLDGAYVTYSAYAALEREVAGLSEALKAIIDADDIGELDSALIEQGRKALGDPS